MDKSRLAKAVAFLREHRGTYMGTVEGGTPWVRAMHVAQVEDDGTIWYATGASSNKVRQIKANPQVCLSIYEAGTDLRVFGSAEMVNDGALRAKLWQDSWKVYFSGPSDPEYVLIRVKPEELELH